MKPTFSLRALTSLAAVIAVALAIVSAPAAAEAAPSLTMTQNCDGYPPSSGVDIHLEGLPPNEPFMGSLESVDDGGNVTFSFGPVDFNADASGSFNFAWGAATPQTYKATVEWAGGTLEASKRADCTLSPGSPTADAGADQNVASGAAVDLDGSGSSDPDGDPLTFAWTQTGGPAVELSGADTATPSFTAPTGPAMLSFRLEVCDDGSPALCETDQVTVTVRGIPPSTGPVLTLTENCEAGTSGVDVLLEGLAGFDSFTATLEEFDAEGNLVGGAGPIELGVGEDGSFAFSQSGPDGQTYKMTVEWAGGTLTKSLTVDCAETDVDTNDYAARVIVNNPTWATGGDGHRKRSFVVKVSNLGKGPLDVSAEDVAARVLVDGAPKGTVKLVSSKVVKPGKRVKFRYSWKYRHVAAGADVEYSGCVNSAGDPNGDNDCASYTTTAEAKP